MATAFVSAQFRVILGDISWRTYEDLLADLRDRSAPRLTFDRGVLEIISPTREHEQYNTAIALLVSTVAEELEIDILNLGSTTYKRDDLMRGFEPDSSFYIQNLHSVLGKSTLDLTVDPPPDLVVEVDITSDSLNKLPIFASVAVPEVWRYDGIGLHILVLAGGAYRESEGSVGLPPLSARVVSEFIAESRQLGSTAWLKKLRQWVKVSSQSSRSV
jgi:Uma2 family endonuclease